MEIIDASFCKYVNPQDIDHAQIFGADRLDAMDQMGRDIEWSKVIVKEYQ